MTKPKVAYVLRPELRHRLRYEAIQNLRIFWILLIVLVFVACTTLPEPQMKTLTLAYEPHPDARLAAVSRDLTAEVSEGHSGFLI